MSDIPSLPPAPAKAFVVIAGGRRGSAGALTAAQPVAHQGARLDPDSLTGMVLNTQLQRPRPALKLVTTD